MTKLFFTTALAMSALCLQAQTVVSLDKAGTLSEKISSAEKYEITNLKISGPLNGTDFILLRDMAGMDQENNKSNGTLETLDLTDASIVKGGEPYYVSYGGTCHVHQMRHSKRREATNYCNGNRRQLLLRVQSIEQPRHSCFYKRNRKLCLVLYSIGEVQFS